MRLAEYAQILLEEDEAAREVIRRVQLRNFKQFCEGTPEQQDEARRMQIALDSFYAELQAIINEDILRINSGDRK